ncbi:hypothetical protein GQX74_002162 [Glossina fuscipes]|nr:hypothetical protein GQX74_002162 [Glossina fuscipes]
MDKCEDFFATPPTQFNERWLRFLHRYNNKKEKENINSSKVFACHIAAFIASITVSVLRRQTSRTFRLPSISIKNLIKVTCYKLAFRYEKGPERVIGALLKWHHMKSGNVKETERTDLKKGKRKGAASDLTTTVITSTFLPCFARDFMSAALDGDPCCCRWRYSVGRLKSLSPGAAIEITKLLHVRLLEKCHEANLLQLFERSPPGRGMPSLSLYMTFTLSVKYDK